MFTTQHRRAKRGPDTVEVGSAYLLEVGCYGALQTNATGALRAAPTRFHATVPNNQTASCIARLSDVNERWLINTNDGLVTVWDRWWNGLRAIVNRRSFSFTTNTQNFCTLEVVAIINQNLPVSNNSLIFSISGPLMPSLLA